MASAFISSSREKVASARESAQFAFSSWPHFVEAIQVKNTYPENQDLYVNADPQWMNEDLEPTPPEKRKWAFMDYCMFYFGLSFGNWGLGSSMIGIGLNWWQAIIVIFVSQIIGSLAMAFNSRAAAVYHLGYPAIARAVFGMYGSYYFVGARAVLAAVWYSIQLYSGASHVSNMLRAIFGDSYAKIPNHIPASVGITTKGMLSFFIFWLVHFGFCFFRPYQLTKFFWFKGFIMFPAVLGVFIYCMVETNGQIGGPLTAAATVTSGMGWAIMNGINSGLGNSATLITNQPDLARWSKTRWASVASQLVFRPLATTLSATFGILATAAINQKWGLTLWNPWDLLDAIQDHYGSPAARFGIFCAAFTWAIYYLGTNIAANLISFGADVALLWPRYIDMKRGFFIVEFLGYAIVPWKILSSAAVFTKFLSGYGLFMASVVAIMLSDYFLLTNGNIMVGWLFDPTSANPYYRYHKGWNIQAIIAYVLGIALPLPGFIASLGAKGVNGAGSNMFYIGWILSFTVSFVSYTAICKVWPTEFQKHVRDNKWTWEEAATTTLNGQAVETPELDGESLKTKLEQEKNDGHVTSVEK